QLPTISRYRARRMSGPTFSRIRRGVAASWEPPMLVLLFGQKISPNEEKRQIRRSVSGFALRRTGPKGFDALSIPALAGITRNRTGRRREWPPRIFQEPRQSAPTALPARQALHAVRALQHPAPRECLLVQAAARYSGNPSRA